MKAKVFNGMNTSELEAKEKELKNELFNLRFQQATGELSNPLRIRECKREIARIKTIVRQREIATAAQ